MMERREGRRGSDGEEGGPLSHVQVLQTRPHPQGGRGQLFYVSLLQRN